LERYGRVLDEAAREGATIYSAAYIMPCPPGGRRKHRAHLALLAQMMKANVPRQVERAKSFKEVFGILRSFPSLGAFLAFQFAVDMNYSQLIDFSEMDFVVAGPGARSGIRKAFEDTTGLSDEEIIREVTEAADREFQRRGLRFRTRWGRPL